MKLSLEPIDVGELVESTCSVMHGYAGDRNIEVNARIEPDLPVVLADLPKLKQILLNLLSNAVKFSSPGGVVDVQVRPIAAAESPLGVTSWELSVSDQGPGIRKEDQEVIFQEFRQVGSGVVHPGGTGLGLALVRRFVTLMGGDVALQSVPGEGSTFRVMLPTEGRQEGHAELLAPLTQAGTIHPRVLLIERQPSALARFIGALEVEGFLPVRARNGGEASEIAKEIHPAVMVVDVAATGEEGWNFFARMSGREDAAGSPTIICLLDGQSRLVLAIGADDWFVEPVQPRRFAEAVNLALEAADAEPGRDSVLIVVADGETRSALASSLDGLDYSCRITSNPAKGLEMALAEPPCAVVADLRGGSQGLEMLYRIQHDRITRHIPILLIMPGENEAYPCWGRSAEDGESSWEELPLLIHELVRRRSGRVVRLAAAGLDMM